MLGLGLRSEGVCSIFGRSCSFLIECRSVCERVGERSASDGGSFIFGGSFDEVLFLRNFGLGGSIRERISYPISIGTSESKFL